MVLPAGPPAIDHRHPQPLPEVPEPGRIVEVRGSTWAVADVQTQGLPRSPADESVPRMQHMVSLQSLQEDRLGEELSVVWELEVGHTVVPEAGLPEQIHPEGFDDPNTLGAFVDALRWGAVTSADPKAFQAPFRSGANVEAYQLEPLRLALSAPRTNLLLADDVGLGKTIEAGLVVQELLLRHRARSVIVVCPPSLALKWRDEMREKFGLDFVIVNSALMAQVRRTHGLAANPFRLFPRIIVSMAWLPTPRAKRLLRDVYSDVGEHSARRYAFDVLVVDEAHHVAPASPSALSGGRGYAVDSNRTIATRALAEHCEHRLFLSATPHNGHTESFTALLEMIDNRRFTRGAEVNENALREVLVRRLKRDVQDKEFKARRIIPLPFTPTHDEEEAFDTLDRLLTASARANGQRRSFDIVALLLKKRFLSSPWAFASTLDAYRHAQDTHADPLTDDDYYAEVLGSDQSDEEEGTPEHPEFVALRASKGLDPLVAATEADIERLVTWGRGYQHTPNSRLEALITYLESVCGEPGRWSNERVVVFTEYTSTLEWIVDVLEQQGFGPVLETIRGSASAEERDRVRTRFTAQPTDEPVRVLVATDAAGEGIDLQDHCHRLVNFDVPFNPSRLEQRIGRIDRYGQRFAPEVRYFAPVASESLYAADLAFMRGIGDKVANIARDVGSVNDIIDPAIIDTQIQRHFAPHATIEGRSAGNRADADVINRSLAGGARLNQQLTELSSTYSKRKAGMHLTPFNARRVVDAALTLTDQPPLAVIGDDRTDAEVLKVPQLGRQWDAATADLYTRPTRPGEQAIRRPITFDEEAAAGRKDLVHAHLGHPLMQKASRTLRSSLFGSDAHMKRVTAVTMSDIPVSCAAVVARLVLVGRGGLRLHEEVFLAGVRFRGRAMAEEKVVDLLDGALDAPKLSLASPAVRRHLAQAWNADGSDLRVKLQEAMSARARRRQASVSESLEKRHRDDVDRARGIYAEFRANLHDSLAHLRGEEAAQREGAAGQLAFALPDDQHRQRQRDMRVMETRLERLDDEEAREVEGIRTRYSDVLPYVSAAALVFVLTPQDAQEWERGE